MFYLVIPTIVCDESHKTLGKLAEQDQTSISGGRERSNEHCGRQQVPTTQQTDYGEYSILLSRCKTKLESCDSERQAAWLPSEGHEKIRAAVGMKDGKSIGGVGSSADSPTRKIPGQSSGSYESVGTDLSLGLTRVTEGVLRAGRHQRNCINE